MVDNGGNRNNGQSDTKTAESIAEDWAADWSEISTGLKKDLGGQIHAQWIRPIEPGRFCSTTGTLELYLPSDFSANWVNDRFADRLALAWKIARPEVRSLKISTHPQNAQMHELRTRKTNIAESARQPHFGGVTPKSSFFTDSNRGQYGQGSNFLDAFAENNGNIPRHIGLDSSLTFDNFVVGEANILGRNAAHRVAAKEKPQFTPLYLKAPTGQGKTHLLHAIGNSYAKTVPEARIFYCSAERFMIEFVSAMRQNKMMEFKSRLRAFDLLLVDDIQFIIGKASTQEEFLHTIDALLGEGKRLVVASDRAPQALDGVDQRLLSRLSMGLVADMKPADIELRRSILRARLTQFTPCDVGEDVIEFLARTISRNVRELVGGLNKLIAYAQLTGQAVTLTLAEEQLSDILSANRRRITIDEIQRTVCQFYKLDRSEMASKRRARAIVRPRQVAMYLAKVLTPRSYPEIGRKFGGRDHSTVIHAVRLIEDLRTRDADMDGDVRTLLQQLES